jgi:integrase
MSTRSGRRGSVKKDASGRWAWVVDYGSGKGNKRRQKRERGFATKREAQAALTKHLADVADGTYIEPSAMTLAEYVDAEWLPIAAMRLRPSTLHSYSRNLRIHVLPKLGGVRLQELTGGQLTRLYLGLLADGLADNSKRRDGLTGLSVRTVCYIHTIVHSVLKSAVNDDLLASNAADKAEPPRQSSVADGTTPMRTWTATQLKTFLAGERHTREYPLWVLLATTGMRRGEALGLGWEHLDLDAGTVRIVRTLVDVVDARDDEPVWSSPKTEAGRRTIKLDPPTVGVLRTHKTAQAKERLLVGPGYRDLGLVFNQPDGRAYHPERVSRTFQARAKRAGLPQIRLHDLRHSWATLALAAGIPAKIVQDRLGHANVAITLNVYSHVSPQMQSDAADRVAALIFGGTS